MVGMELELPSGNKYEYGDHIAVLRFCAARNVLSTSALNGGLRRDLSAAFNRSDTPRPSVTSEMLGKDMESHLRAAARLAGLDDTRVTGLSTGANTDNSAVCTLTNADFSVTSIATAGIEINGSRAGMPATLTETDRTPVPLGGTINVILDIDADLSDGALTRALITATEAKSAALQELLAECRYTGSLATGSGTDGLIVAANPASKTKLTQSGGHFLLGEYIARAVSESVGEALRRQTGLDASAQRNVFRRLGRFGVTEDAVLDAYRAANGSEPDAEFRRALRDLALDGSNVVLASLCAHLLDQLSWGLILPGEALLWGAGLLDLLRGHSGIETRGMTVSGELRRDAAVRALTDSFISCLLELLQ